MLNKYKINYFEPKSNQMIQFLTGNNMNKILVNE